MLEVKPEILTSIAEKNCCGMVFVRTMFFMYAQRVKDGFLINAPTFVIEKLVRILSNFYPNADINIWQNSLFVTGNIYNLITDLDLEHLFEIERLEDCCKLTLLKSLFVVIGNLYFVGNSNENSKGYNLEFVCKSDTINPTLNLLNFFGFELKTIKRQNNNIVYTKNSTIICDLLVKLGAVYSSFEVQNNLAMREIRNLTNRQNNCFENNINKTISASNLQLKAISYIIDNFTIDYLDDSLKEVALARLANPEVSLNELKILLKNKISRAGIKYRLDKIIAIYQQLKGENK